MDGVAEVVGKNLDLDVAGMLHKALHVHGVVAEGHTRLGTGRGVSLLKLLGVPGLAHALAATAGRRLDKQGIPDLVGNLESLLERLDLAGAAGNAGHACGDHGLLGVGLLAHAVDDIGGGTDEDKVVVSASAGKVGVL